MKANATDKKEMTRSKPSGVHIILLIIPLSYGLSDHRSDDHNRLTQVDSIAHNYLKEEKYFWDDVLSNRSDRVSHPRSQILHRIYEFHETELNLNFGKIESLQPLNEFMIELVTAINRTQHQVSQILVEKKFDVLKGFAEELVQPITDKVKTIFEETRRGPFMAYIRANSDRCHRPFVTVNDEDLYTDNIVLDCYRTVAEALVKGYMVTQMFRMVLDQEMPGK